MKILVTGGAGFIGSHFVRTLLQDAWGLERPSRVVVLDKLTYAGNLDNLAPVSHDRRLRVVVGDILDRELVLKLMRKVDVVVHFAAESHVDRSINDGADFVMTNVVGTQTLLEAAHVAGVERFLHVSTDEVYGSIATGSWTESEPLLPNSPYSASKAASDLMARSYHRTHGVPVVVTRCSNNYGPYQHPEKLIPHFVTTLVDGGTAPLYGEGTNVRDWLHVDDHCRALYLALTRAEPGEIYNIGGGTELANKDLIARLLAAVGVGWEKVVSVEDRLGHDLRYSVDASKIQRELGFEPRIEFNEGLAETVEWYLQNRPWWDPGVSAVNYRTPA